MLIGGHDARWISIYINYARVLFMDIKSVPWLIHVYLTNAVN